MNSFRAAMLAIAVVTAAGCSEGTAPELTMPNPRYEGNWDSYGADGLDVGLSLGAARCDARRCAGTVWYSYAYRPITEYRRLHVGNYHLSPAFPDGATIADQSVTFAFADGYSDRLFLNDVSLRVTIDVAPVGDDTLAGTIRINAVTASGDRVATTGSIAFFRRQ